MQDYTQKGGGWEEMVVDNICAKGGGTCGAEIWIRYREIEKMIWISSSYLVILYYLL